MRHQETTSQGKVRQTTRPVTQSDSAREDARAQGAESARGPVLGSLSGAHDRLGNGSIGEMSAQVRPESPRELYVSQLLALETAVSTDMSAYLPWNASLDWMLFVDRWYGLLFESQADSAVESVGPATAEPALARKPMGGADPRSPDGLGEWIESLRAMGGSGRPLSAQERGFLAEVHGRAMPNIMIHEGAVARAAAAAVNARAFTVETDIYLGEAASLESAEGAAMLAHESTHALQHIAGRDRSIAGQISRPGQPLEVEAEARGRDALRIWETRGEAWAFEPPAATDSRGQLIAELMRAQLPAPGPAPAGKVEAQVEGVLVAEARAKLDNLRFSVELDEQLSDEERAELLTELDRLHVGVATDLGLSARVAELSAPQLLAQLERVLPPYVGLAEQVEGLTHTGGDQALGDALGGLSEPSGARLQTMIRSLSSALGLGPVDVHLGEEGAARARAAGTRGLMEGGEVFLDAARFDANSADARGLIAHELTHAAQLQLDPLTGPDAGLYAEAEAHVAAEAFARGGALPELQAGIPQGHVAAEGDLGGTELQGLVTNLRARNTELMAATPVPPAPANTATTNASEDGAQKLEQYQDGVDGVADLIGDLDAFDELCEACDDGEDTGPALSKVKGSDSYNDLTRMWQGAKEGGEQSGAMMSAFNSEFSGRGFWGSTEQAFDLVCSNAKADAKPEPQAGDARNQANEAEQNAAVVAEQVANEEGGEVTPGTGPEVAAPNAGIDPAIAAQLDASVPETLPPIQSFESMKGISDEQVSAIVDQLDYQRAFSENTPSIRSSRTPQIMETLADNFGGSFISSFTDQAVDTLVWDNIGWAADQGLKSLSGGKLGTPMIGPLIGLAQNPPWTAGAWGGDQFGAVFGKDGQQGSLSRMGDSWNRMGSGASMTDNVGLFCAFAADLFGSLRDFLDMLATICGTLSALCYVVGGLLIIFGLALVWLAGIGAPLITAGGWLCRAGNLLGRVNNILAAVVRALSVLTTIFRTAAAFMVPSDQYAAQLQLLGADASTFGDKAGAKAADSTAGNLNNRLRAGTERRVNDGIANRSPQGQAGADQATRVQQLQDADAQRLASEAEAERQRQAQNQPPPAQDPANPNAHPPNGQNPQNGPNQDPNNPNRQPNDQDPNDPSRRRPGDVDTEPPRRSLFRRIVGKLPIINTAVTEFEHVARDVQDMFQNPARVGREQLSPEAWRQIEARVNGKAEQLGNRLRDLNADLDRARNEPQQDAEQIANIQREISSTERKLARVRSSLQEAQRAIPAAEAHQNALNRESADQEADPNGPTGRQRELERTRRQVRDLQNERRRVEGELQSANERLQAAQAAESEAQQRAADAERAHDDHVNSDEYRQREQAHRQEHARQQQQRMHEMDRLNTEAADLERRATHAEQAAPLRQTAQQQRAQADEAKQRAQRALTDMKAFENTRIKLTSDNGGADGMTNRRLISVDGDTVTVTNGRGQTETFPISAIVGPKSLRQAAGRVTRENAEAARLTTEAEAATTRADGLAPEGTDPQALRTQASALRDQSLSTLAQHDQNLNPGELPDAQRDQLRTARTQATGAHSSASGQTQSLQTRVNTLQGENTRLNSELTQAQRNLQEQEALDRRMPGIQQNADLNRGSSGNATGGVGSAYKGVGEGLTRSLGIVEGLFGLLSTATQHSAYMQSKITRDANGKITEDKRTIGTAAEGATQGMRNSILDATLGVMGHEHAMTDQRETPEQLLTFGQQQAERERNRAATIQALLACAPPITNIEQMNAKRTAALAAYDQYNLAWGDARKAFEAEQIVTQLSAQTLSMAQEGQPLQQSSQAMSAPLNQSVADEQSRQGVLSGLSSQAMQQPEGGIAGIVTGLIAKLAEHADRMDDQPNPPTADSGEQIQQGPTRANEEKTQRAEQANTASQEQRAFLDQAIAARATQEQHVTTSITTLEQKHQEEQAILAEIKNQKAAAIVRQEQHRAVVEENAAGFVSEYNQMEAWRADYQAKRTAVETMQ